MLEVRENTDDLKKGCVVNGVGVVDRNSMDGRVFTGVLQTV
jgi:hypothetical protein